MNREQILNNLNEIFEDLFETDDIEITEETTPQDIEDWDSMGHIYLTVEIEDEFGIKLGEEMAKIENVGDVISLIVRQLEEKNA